MWLLDGAEYFSPLGARYLTYQNDVRQYVADLVPTRHGGVLPLLHRHMIAMSYQLAQFRWGGGGRAGCMLDERGVLPAMQDVRASPAGLSNALQAGYSAGVQASGQTA